MQVPLVLAIATLILGITTLVTTTVLLVRKQQSFPDHFDQLPERLMRLETLHDQLVMTLREGFKESRVEMSNEVTGIRNNLDQHLSALRAEMVALRSEIVTQLISLSTTIPVHITALGAAITEDIHQFVSSVDNKLETTNQLVRSEIQTQITTMQSVLVNSFSDLSTRTADASVFLQTMVKEKLATVSTAVASEQGRLRASLESSFTALKSEVTTALNQSENKQTTNSTALQNGIDRAIGRLLSQLKDSLNAQTQQLADLTTKTDSALATLKGSVESRLTAIAESNENKLEQMRATVDEKLHSTLEKRLSDCFGLVGDQLGRVQTGLGEMKDLASSVGDLKRVLTNVKSRGGFAEVQLGAQLKNVLAANQYKINARVKEDTTESVEFAICLPGNNGEECLLPIDAKFPRDPWERLENARESAGLEEIKRAADIFESAIKTEAKRISEKYINPPKTLNFAYMYLPTEALFAEVVRNPGLLDEIQTKYRVSVAGPTTLMALLISFQMGFQTLAIQKKGSEVWDVLARAKVQFGKFGDLMTGVERKVGNVQKTLQEIGTRTRVINRTLSGVDTVESNILSAPTEIAELSAEGDLEIANGVPVGKE